jgi:hypothetical protein
MSAIAQTTAFVGIALSSLGLGGCSCVPDNDMHPTDIVGEWQAHAESIDEPNLALGAREMSRQTVLSLREDGSYVWNTGGHKTTGTWTLSEAIVRLYVIQPERPASSSLVSRDEETVRVELLVDQGKLVVIDSRGAGTKERFWFEPK